MFSASRKTIKPPVRERAALERESKQELRRLYTEYANWRNALDWADTPETIDRAILGMAFTNWAIRNIRHTYGIHREEPGTWPTPS